MARFKAAVAGCTKVTDLKATVNGHASARCLRPVYKPHKRRPDYEAIGCFSLPMDLDGNDPSEVDHG